MSYQGEVAEVELRQRINGSGVFVTETRRSATVTFELMRDSLDESGPWTLTASVPEPDRVSVNVVVLGGRGELSLEGQISGGEKILLRRVTMRGARGNVFTADVRETWIGSMDPIEHGSRIGIEIDLSPTPLALSDDDEFLRFARGESSSPPGLENHQSVVEAQDREPAIVSIGPLSLRLTLGYRDARAKDSGRTHLVRVEVPMLLGESSDSVLNGAPADVLGRLEQPLEDALRVLSVLSRRHVSWQRISLFVPHSGELGAFRARLVSVHRSRDIGRATEGEDRIVNPYWILPGELDAVVRRHAVMHVKDALNAAIIYMIEARHTQFIESSVVNAFTALEAICGAVAEERGRHQHLSSSGFKRLRSDVASAVRSQAEKLGISAELVEAIIEKVPELNRPTLLASVQALVTELDVRWNDLWLRVPTISEGLRPAVRRRNSFIHAGSLKYPAASQLDAILVCALVERTIFRLLEVPEKWIPDHVDGNLREVARSSCERRHDS